MSSKDREIRVIIKQPNEYPGHFAEIDNDLKSLQRIVGGLIETVPCAPRALIICNEEGKLLGLPPNFIYGSGFKDVIMGTVIVCDGTGEELSDVPISMDEWGAHLKHWGN